MQIDSFTPTITLRLTSSKHAREQWTIRSGDYKLASRSWGYRDGHFKQNEAKEPDMTENPV